MVKAVINSFNEHLLQVSKKLFWKSLTVHSLIGVVQKDEMDKFPARTSLKLLLECSACTHCFWVLAPISHITALVMSRVPQGWWYQCSALFTLLHTVWILLQRNLTFFMRTLPCYLQCPLYGPSMPCTCCQSGVDFADSYFTTCIYLTVNCRTNNSLRDRAFPFRNKF